MFLATTQTSYFSSYTQQNLCRLSFRFEKKETHPLVSRLPTEVLG